MSPEDAPAELVETGGETLHSRLYFAERITFEEAKAAVAEVLAAVLPLAQAAARDEGAASRGMHGDADEPNPYREGRQS